MREKIFSMAVMLLFFSLTSPLFANNKSDKDVMKSVFQCDFNDPKRVNSMLGTINNVIKYYKKVQKNLILKL